MLSKLNRQREARDVVKIKQVEKGRYVVKINDITIEYAVI